MADGVYRLVKLLFQ